MISAVNERDVEAYLACCTDDIQLYSPVALFTGPHEGAAGIRRFFQDIEDASPDFRLELERLELVGDQALAFFKIHASGRISGVPLDSENAVVYDFADDRIKRVRIFSDRQEALETLGCASKATAVAPRDLRQPGLPHLATLALHRFLPASEQARRDRMAHVLS